MNNIMGKRIKERREMLGLTLEQVADRLGLQKSAISKYERGATSISTSLNASPSKMLTSSNQ